jgi:hypothetical protein
MNDGNNQGQSDKSSTDWWLVLFTAMLVLVGGLQAWVLSHHSRLIKQSVEQMKRAVAAYEGFVRTSEGMLALTRESNNTAAEAASAATQAARTAKDTLHIAHRPWINAERAELVNSLVSPPESRFDLQVKLALKNTGTSIATDGLLMSWAMPDNATTIGTNIEKAWQQTEDMQRAKRANTPWESGFVLNPGSILEHIIRMGSDDISSQQVSRGDFYILGCILYRDQFATTHRTQFCFRPTSGVTDPTRVEFTMAAWFQKAD